MLLRITHQTDLSYSGPISESVMELRMAPRQEADQHRLSFELAIGPAANVNSYFDWLDNVVHFFTINDFHSKIRIVATSVLEIDRVRPNLAALPDIWPLQPSDDYALYDYLTFGGPIINTPAISELAESLRPRNGMRLSQLTEQMVRLVNGKFTYKKGTTTSASSVADMLEHGSGVCQDFTHLMIGLARTLKIPARYVSGMIHSEDHHYRGDRQTHAWCELMFPSIGWVGFDPANNCVVGQDFVKVGIGRDYRDVPPNRGVYRGNAKETIDVSVRTELLSTIPPELAPERTLSLDMPLESSANIPLVESAGHHQAQQQQQQQE